MEDMSEIRARIGRKRAGRHRRWARGNVVPFTVVVLGVPSLARPIRPDWIGQRQSPKSELGQATVDFQMRVANLTQTPRTPPSGSCGHGRRVLLFPWRRGLDDAKEGGHRTRELAHVRGRRRRDNGGASAGGTASANRRCISGRRSTLARGCLNTGCPGGSARSTERSRGSPPTSASTDILWRSSSHKRREPLAPQRSRSLGPRCPPGERAPGHAVARAAGPRSAPNSGRSRRGRGTGHPPRLHDVCGFCCPVGPLRLRTESPAAFHPIPDEASRARAAHRQTAP